MSRWTTRRIRRRRVLATGDRSPVTASRILPPRDAIARSTRYAITKVAISVMIAMTVLRCSFQNDAAMGRFAAPMARQSTSAVLLDSLGTLVAMEWPAPHLREEGLRRSGVDVGEEAAERAVRAEISYYLEHQLEGSDPVALSDLRDRCAEVVRDSLGMEGLD